MGIRSGTGTPISVSFGGAGDVPVPADYFGLGRAQIAVFRPASAEWFLRRDDGSTTRVPFGDPGDLPVPADYFGLGRAQIAVFRPSTREWFLRADTGATTLIQWGGPGGVPVALLRRDPVPTPPATAQTYVIAGPGIGDGFEVDDDIAIFLNGVALVNDDSHTASTIGPVRFTAKVGDLIRIRAYDIGGCRWFSPLYLYRLDGPTGPVTRRLLTPGVSSDNCSHSAGVFFDQTFEITF